MRERGGKIATSLLVVLLGLGLAGCTRATPENLLNSMAEKTATMQSVEMNVNFQLAASGDILGTTADLTIDMDAEMQSTVDPAVAYIEGEMSMAFMGQKETVDLEGYTEEEDGKYIGSADQIIKCNCNRNLFLRY